MEIRIEGERELIKALRGVDRALPKEIAVIHREIAEPIAELAAARAPHLSGRLAGSIRAQGSQRAARIAAGRSSIPYAGPIHFGWAAHGIEGQPFIFEALEQGGAQAVDDYDRLLGDFLDRVFTQLGAR